MSYFRTDKAIADRMRYEFQNGTSEAIVLSIMEPVRAERRGGELTMFLWLAEVSLRVTVPALVWLRDERRRSITHESVNRFLQLDVLRSLAVDRAVPAAAGIDAEPLPEFPDAIALDIARYIAEMPGADISDPCSTDKASTAARNQAMCVMELTSTLTKLKFPAETA